MKGGIDHLHDESLLRLRQAVDAFDLLQELGRGSALGALRLLADQFFHRDGECAGKPGQERGGHPMAADLVGGDDLLGDAQLVGELGLGHAEGLAALGDALAHRLKEGPLVGCHGSRHGGRGADGVAVHG